MKFSLQKIVLENFKTYEGKVEIGPLKDFVGVIGPNGTGKSNLLDAISFAFGEKVSTLRVKSANELIHGAHVGKPVSRKASVKVVFQYEDKTSCSFERTVSSKSTQHFSWNNETVSSAVYLQQLEKLGINIKAKNIIVYQGKIEDIAMMSGKERTAMFEESSGSKELIREYEELKKKVNEFVDRTQDTYIKKRAVRAEYNAAKQEKNEAVKHKQLSKELADKIVELQLFKLYHNEKDIEEVGQNIVNQQSALREAEIIKEDVEGKLKQAKKALGLARRELDNLEKESRAYEEEVKQSRGPAIKAKEESSHLKKKVETACKSLEQAKEAHKKHEETIGILNEELARLEEEKRDFEAKSAEESLSQGIDVELEQSQVDNYNEKKSEVANRSAKYQQQIVSLSREQRSDQETLDINRRKFSEIESLIKQKTLEAEEGRQRCEKLLERINDNKKEKEQLEVQQESLAADCGVFKEQMECMQNELDDVLSQLGNAHLDKYDENRRKKKHQVVQKLKVLFPGVFDRLINLCKPIHQKYSIAITKVMGKYVDAIVVDKKETAQSCIHYLKGQMMEPETFLPLDYIQTNPLKDHLRKERPSHKCHLLYDVVEFQPPQIKRAVLFATKSVLVCETAEAARDVAYNLVHYYPDPDKVDVVALDGTYFQKSGLISGGSADLARKARRWDEKIVDQLKERKEQLLSNLKDLNKKLRIESDLNVTKSQIRGYASRILPMEQDLKKSEEKINQLTVDIESLQTELQKLEPKICEIQKKIEVRGLQLKTLEKKSLSIEDQVFAEFCARIGVPNIRAYEESGLRAYEERAEKRIEFEDSLSRIVNQLDYERTLNTKSNVERWSDEVKQRQKDLASSEHTESKLSKKVDRATCSLEQHMEVVSVKRKEVNSLEKNVKKVQLEVKQASEPVDEAKKELIKLENQHESLLLKRKSLLIQCAVEDISIPILEGNLAALVPGGAQASTDSTTDSTTSSNTSHLTTSGIVVDYDELAVNLRRIRGDPDVQNIATAVAQEIAQLNNMLNSLQAPRHGVEGQLEKTTGRLQKSNVEFSNIREEARKARESFEKVKRQRFDCFMECFDFVSNEIDNIYKQITQSSSAMAMLTADDPEEPYLSGINFACVAPGKACKPMRSLSGGEKTIASLALLIALHKFRAAPFLILDEMDAALDKSNIAKVAHYFSSQKVNFQTIAISLTPEFYCHSDALIGITRHQPQGTDDSKSQAFLYDLSKHPA